MFWSAYEYIMARSTCAGGVVWHVHECIIVNSEHKFSVASTEQELSVVYIVIPSITVYGKVLTLTVLDPVWLRKTEKYL